MRLLRFLLVAGAGAFAGLMLAPKKGVEFRRELEQRLGPLVSNLGLRTAIKDRITMTPAAEDPGLQAKIEETRRRLEEQAGTQGPA